MQNVSWGLMEGTSPPSRPPPSIYVVTSGLITEAFRVEVGLDQLGTSVQFSPFSRSVVSDSL